MPGSSHRPAWTLRGAGHNGRAAPSPILDFVQEMQTGYFDNRLNLFARHSGKIFKKILQRITRAQMVKKALDRHARPSKHRFPAQPLWVYLHSLGKATCRCLGIGIRFLCHEMTLNHGAPDWQPDSLSCWHRDRKRLCGIDGVAGQTECSPLSFAIRGPTLQDRLGAW